MNMLTLGKTGITVPHNAFGALPIQRVSLDTAVDLLRKAYAGGMRFFDTARAYSDSEQKIGHAFSHDYMKQIGITREDIVIASKTMASTPEQFRHDLDRSLRDLDTEYIDIYQFHCVKQCYRPGDGTGMYEAISEAKAQGKIRHIGITAHLIGVAEEIVGSGLYETLQFPFSYLASERDIRLVESCRKADMGFIAMKGLCGGLLTNSEACMAFLSQYPVLPIWGIQREEELRQWLSFFERDAVMTDGIKAYIGQDRKALMGDFCRGCGYCAPCTVGIKINDCARMSQLIRRAPSENFLSDEWKEAMWQIEECIDCGACMSRCPYGLDIPTLLRKNLADYKEIVSGRISVK
ncbi:MAG: aldo/keto reductase [Clostridia bacterium]|nr:aldo/keto reductase [Clostridia bacterium]